ncbi:type I restriction-modification system endonuclease [Amycolatopsis solani]|uniref:type I restriction-modification system endonuclease n=1 Tax=Amycolatopsis solani TaxID=3028615 RepID=UPI0025B16297|nr:type I restriction-modification system endonuclease [Amycolatopsis sp. MEP2-6]
MANDQSDLVQRLAAASANFGYMLPLEPLLVRYGAGAELHVFTDPNVALYKMRQFAEVLVQCLAVESGHQINPRTDLATLIETLYQRQLLPGDVYHLFERIRRSGNRAVHRHLDDQREALTCLHGCFQLGVWFHQTLGQPSSARPESFIPPARPADFTSDEVADLRRDLEKLRDDLVRAWSASQAATDQAHSEAEARQQAEAMVIQTRDDLQVAFDLALETEQALSRAQEEYNARLADLEVAREGLTAAERNDVVQRAIRASGRVRLSEAQTRAVIDEQLRAAGWEVDSERLRHGLGARPVAGKNMAIAEWPTSSGPADYILFCGLTPVGAVEAKAESRDVSGDLGQARRYSRDLSNLEPQSVARGPWGDFKVPFLFATNGRPYLEQLRTASGLWFQDVRRPTNLPRPRREWPSPTTLWQSMALDRSNADEALRNDSSFAPRLREYQREAIAEVEKHIVDGIRAMLVAMATGTGKTVTCLGFVERMLRNERFNRILFLVDRLALGEQAEGKFKSEIVHSVNTLAQIYDVATIDKPQIDAETRLHIATVQSMVHRLADHDSGQARLDPDLYDCIVVDECHRGYSLDRAMTPGELEFRSEAEYQSEYRRVLDHFDAVKIGLTATPAAHTVAIFGDPIYTYPYRRAVIEGYLIDHEPPTQIATQLNTFGIHLDRGTEANILDLETGQVELHQLQDELNFEVDDFNRRVITPGFNDAVCRELAQEITPGEDGKTIIFCVNDAHADLVVDSLNRALEDLWGEIDGELVMKITSRSDRPQRLIRRFRNERTPQVAVTVDLLTTGVDIPKVDKLVFIRRVRSRILFEQMLGRATRPCPEIGKETFRIYDAVGLYAALKPLTSMQPVIANISITAEQLTAELIDADRPEHVQVIAEQLAARLQRRLPRLTAEAAEAFARLTARSPADFIDEVIRAGDFEQLVSAFTRIPELAVLVERGVVLTSRQAVIDERQDEVIASRRDYGNSIQPAEYLQSFRRLLQDLSDVPSLDIALRTPSELSRKQLSELLTALETRGFTEANLRTAVREVTNRDFGAKMIGYVLHFGRGLPLVPFEHRVDAATDAVLSSEVVRWTTMRRNLLKKIAAALKAQGYLDRQLLDDGQFRQEFGGFTRLDRAFDGQLNQVLNHLTEQVWADTGVSER